MTKVDEVPDFNLTTLDVEFDPVGGEVEPRGITPILNREFRDAIAEVIRGHDHSHGNLLFIGGEDVLNAYTISRR